MTRDLLDGSRVADRLARAAVSATLNVLPSVEERLMRLTASSPSLAVFASRWYPRASVVVEG